MMLSERFDDAFAYASALHRDDRRKGTEIPYLTHLMSVAALVLEDGGTEDEAIAGLLHDAVEDHGAEQRDVIHERFGSRVAEIVRACSDSILPAGEPKAPWGERKDAYLAHLRASDDHGYLRVTLADKLHNARCILSDLRTIGREVFERFTAGADQLWYYDSLVTAFDEQAARGFASPMIYELERVVGALKYASTTHSAVEIYFETLGDDIRGNGGFPDMFDAYTDRAKRVVNLAQEEARMANHDHVGTEHILLGLIHEGGGVAAQALDALDVSLAAVRQQLEEIVGPGTSDPNAHLLFTPPARNVLELSLREALQRGHNYVSTEDILLGLISEGEGVAIEVLKALKVSLPELRDEVLRRTSS